VYTVQYCNNGALPAPNSYIDLELDPQLSYQSSGVPAINIGNNTYRFQIGTLAPNFCDQFNVKIYVSCASIQGQYHCSEAHIYPDTSCVPVDPNYTGAEVDVRAICTADSLQFILKNVGTGPMSVPLGYIVIEDGIMFKSATNNPLPKGDSMTISLPANGSTWRIEANQEPLFPGLSQPQLSVEGCTTAGTFSTGFLGQFAVNDNPPTVDIDCTVNSGPFDPNDKQGFPVGYGDDHYIRPGTDIEYLIHFQNIGTDTAFNIVVLDTLSNWLDISTVRPGASSFPYFFEIKSSNILAFNFFNIQLPDSTTNAMGSTGFFKFRISPADTVPLETDIYNSAAIYFDYNQPVITNTTQHRIGENFVLVGVWEPTQPQYEVLVAPNPMTATAQIIIKGAPASGQYRLRVFDMQGRVVVEMPGSTPQFMIKKGDLNEGIYLFGVELDGNLIGKGKMIIR
jgi:uncharacterized repeat protein (TIGR01451 family)